MLHVASRLTQYQFFLRLVELNLNAGLKNNNEKVMVVRQSKCILFDLIAVEIYQEEKQGRIQKIVIQ